MATKQNRELIRRLFYSPRIIYIVIIAVLISLPFVITHTTLVGVSQERDAANRELVSQARAKHDPSICDQISGGLRAKEAIPATYKGTVVYDGRAAIPALSEATLKKRCKDAAQRVTDN